MRPFLAVIVAIGCLGGSQALADIVPRSSTPSGSVIARKLGEEVRFIDVSSWQSVDVQQAYARASAVLQRHYPRALKTSS